MKVRLECGFGAYEPMDVNLKNPFEVLDELLASAGENTFVMDREFRLALDTACVGHATTVVAPHDGVDPLMESYNGVRIDIED